jgi:hypothetical protein
MGMTFWIHVLDGRKIKENQTDLSALYRASEELDKLCDELGVEKLSAFADHTDLEYNMKAEFGGDDDGEEPPLDPETGWPFGIDQMHWFQTLTGLKTLQALGKRLQTEADLPGPLAKSRKKILADLKECISEMKAVPKGCKFHLAVVM